MHQYEVNVKWDRDRKGIMCSPDLQDQQATDGCIEVATPPEFPKGIPGIWSPEHLFTAAVSSCLMTTFLAVAENSNLKFSSFSCKSRGILDQIDGKYLMTEVILEPVVYVHDTKEIARAERVLAKAGEACLISNSIRSKVTMNARVYAAEPVKEES